MNRYALAGMLVTGMLSFPLTAGAQPQPPLPKAAQSFESGSVHVDRYGAPGARPIVFIPGLTCGPWEWSREIAAYSKTYSVYALTLPGFNGRKAITAPLFDTVSADIWSLIASRHLKRPVIIGHSLGGTMAILLATQHSDRLGGAIAVDGLPTFPGLEKQTVQQRRNAAAQMSAMMSALKTPAQFEAAERAYSLPNLVTAQSDVDAIAPLAARSDGAASGAWLAEDFQIDLRDGLKNANVPVLEITAFDAALEGKFMTGAPAKQAYYQTFFASAPDAKVQVIEGSRHFIMYDQPQKLDAAITAFLRAVP